MGYEQKTGLPSEEFMREQIVVAETQALSKQITENAQLASRLTKEMNIEGLVKEDKERIGEELQKVVEKGVALSNQRAALFAQHGIDVG